MFIPRKEGGMEAEKAEEPALSKMTRLRTLRLVLSPPPEPSRKLWPWALLGAVILGWLVTRWG